MSRPLDIGGRLEAGSRVRVGVIGCGSHAFRNVYPAFQFAPIDLVATCDLDLEKARAYARQFGALHAYDDHRQLLGRDDIDAVFIVTNYNEQGRPRYPALAGEALAAGKHVWCEKPLAASTDEVERLQDAADAAGRSVMVGLKKMFFPANVKAAEMMRREAFGPVSLVTLQYPQHLPTVEEMRAYAAGEPVTAVVHFLDHLCHPVSLLLLLLGMPQDMVYQRSAGGAGVAVFTFEHGPVASLAFTAGAARAGGMERTLVVGGQGHHITIDNNVRLAYHRDPPTGAYGCTPSFYVGEPEQVSAVWEPEFSLGQLYNKGLFLLGYAPEVQAFSEAVLRQSPPVHGTLAQAWQITRIFEAFAEGPGHRIAL